MRKEALMKTSLSINNEDYVRQLGSVSIERRSLSVQVRCPVPISFWQHHAGF